MGERDRYYLKNRRARRTMRRVRDGAEQPGVNGGRNMVKTGQAVGVGLLGGLMVFGASGAAEAASDVGVGGYHDQAVEAAHRSLLAGGPEDLESRLQISIESGASSALTAFTPRIGGLGLAVARQPVLRPDAAGARSASLLRQPESRQVQLGISERAEIIGVPIDLTATAGMAQSPDGLGEGESGFVVGGELAVSGLRLDASYGDDATLLGLEGSRMTAGVAYGFGPLDARISYSVVESEAEAVETSLLTLGSRLTLRPGIIVQGDLAYAGEEDGEATTAGRVSLRLNF